MVKIKYYRSKLHCGSHPLSKKLVIFAFVIVIDIWRFPKSHGGTPIASSSRHGYDLVFFQAMVTTLDPWSPPVFQKPQKTLGDWRAAGALVQVDITLLASASDRLRRGLRQLLTVKAFSGSRGLRIFGVWLCSFLKYLCIYNLSIYIYIYIDMNYPIHIMIFVIFRYSTLYDTTA